MGLNPYDDAVEGLADEQQGNPYDAIVQQAASDQVIRLKAAAKVAADTSPDEAAQNADLSRRYRIPLELTDQAFRKLRQQDAIDRNPYDRLLQDAPHVATWLEQPINAAVSRDDLDNLTAIERALGVARNIGGSAGAGLTGFLGGLWGSVQAGAEIADAFTRTPPRTAGLIIPGTIDLFRQPKVKNADGSISTVDSFSVNIDGREVLLPTVTPDGRHLSQDAAIAEYEKTGLHLGIFDTPENATAYARRLHEEYAAGRYDTVPFFARVADYARGGVQAGEQVSARLRGPQPDAGFLEQAIYSGIESLGNMAPAIGLGLLTGGVGTLSAIGLSTGGQAYGQARAQGVRPGKAAAFGFGQGAIEVATEYIPAHRLLGDLAKKSGLIAMLAHQFVPEIAGEEVATVLQDLNEWATLPANKDRTFADYIRERPSAAAATVISTIVAVGATTTAAHATVTFADRLGRATQESKTFQRSPEKLGELADAIVQGTGADTAYLPLDAFTTFFQKQGQNPAEVAAQLTGNPNALEDAKAAGHDLAVPMRAYVMQIASNEEASTFFQNEMRLDPNEQNGREAATFTKALDTALATPPAEDTSSAGKVRAQILDQLTSAGVEPARARAYAGLYESVFGTLGQRAGLDPLELYERYRLQVRQSERGNVVTDEALAQAEPGFEPPAGARYESDFARGAIHFGPEGQVTIDLFKNANASTFLHESGHLFLQVLQDLAPKSEQMAADLQALQTWFGVKDAAKLLDKNGQIKTKYHEQFARGFEAYLRDGKAPSPEVRTIFARFRAWLHGVYRSLVELDVDLTPDVRGVFDRLVATDEAIARAEAEAHVQPLFTDAAAAGMTEMAFEKYRAKVADASDAARQELTQRIAKEQAREQSATWKAARKELRAEVTTELQQQPVYQVRAALRGDLKGASLDVVAEAYGFTSADELRQTLKTTPPLPRAVAAEVNRRMTERFGDPLSPEQLHDRALDAVLSDRRADVVRAELAALTAGMREKAIPPASALKAYAEQTIAGMRVRDLRPGLYLASAQRASAKAFELQGSGDRALAIQAKQQELVSLALYRAARDAQQQVERQHARLVRFTSDSTRARIGKAGADYLEQIDGILDRYELARVPLGELDRRAGLRDWIEGIEKQGLPAPEIPANVLEESRRVNWRELTTEDLAGVHDAVQSIAHLARLKNRLLTAKTQRDLDVATAAIEASIRSTGQTKPLPLEFTPKDEKARKWAEYYGSMDKIAELARALDGYQDGGPMWEYVIRPINEAADREAVLGEKASREISALFSAYSSKEIAHLHDKVFIPILNDSLSKEARLAVALNWGNEDGRQRLRDGRGWSDAQVQAILDTLDARDVAFVNGVWQHNESWWPLIEAKQRRVTGIAPEKVQAAPFSAAGGNFTGGYYTLDYDPRLSPTAKSNLKADAASLHQRAAYVHATTRRNHTKARQEKVSLPIRLELGVFFKHVDMVIHDLTHHEMLIDVDRVLRDRGVQNAVYETKHGDITFERFVNALEAIADGNRPVDTDNVLRYLRTGVTAASLGWNVWSALQQPVGVFNGMERVGIPWVLKGMLRFTRDAASMENTVAWVRERSDMMRLREKTGQREVVELRRQIARPGGWFDKIVRTVTADKLAQQDITESFFWMIGKMQLVADVTTWLGAYEKGIADHANKRSDGTIDEDRVVALANQAVLDSQGGGQIKDLSEKQRGGDAAKAWTTLYGFGNVMFNRTRAARGRFRMNGSLGQLLSSLLLLYVFPAASIVTMKRLLGRGDDDESWMVAFAKESLNTALNALVYVRELGGAVGVLLGGTGEARGYQSLTTRPFKVLYDAAVQARQGEVDRAAIRIGGEAAGVIFHVPAPQLQRTVDGFTALQEGKTANPAAVLVGPPMERR